MSTSSPLAEIKAPRRVARWRWIRWRGLLLVVVFLMALSALQCGVGASDRDIVGADFPVHVYYSLGLFVLGGLDLGTPTGGLPLTRGMLWCAYFLAPAITTSALVEAVLRAMSPQTLRLRMMRGHAVVVGCGRLGLVYLRAMRASGFKGRAVVVEKAGQPGQLNLAAERYGAEILMGDFALEGMLETLRIGRASQVALLTGNDYVNLDAASRILRTAPELAGKVLAHVADIRLMRMIQDHDLLPGCRVFNSHRRAAIHLVNEKLIPRFRETRRVDTVVLAGFGRFGQTVLHELQKSDGDHYHHVVIIDPNATHQVGVYHEMVPKEEGVHIDILEADMRDPTVWARLEACKVDVERAVIIVGTDDASLNIRTALALGSRHTDSYVVARCFAPSDFTRLISEREHFEVVATSELLQENLGEHWFDSKGVPSSRA